MSNEAQKTSGKLIAIAPEQTGTKNEKPWTKQVFAIEIPGKFPKKASFTAWNDKCDLIPQILGTEVVVSYIIDAREYNDKWYNDLVVVNIESVGSPAKPSKAPVKVEPVKSGLDITNEDDDLPF